MLKFPEVPAVVDGQAVLESLAPLFVILGIGPDTAVTVQSLSLDGDAVEMVVRLGEKDCAEARFRVAIR